MPKCAQLVAAVYPKDWAYAKQLSESFYNGNGMFRVLVDKESHKYWK